MRTNFNLNTNDKNAIINRLADIGYNEINVCNALNINDINDISWRFIPIYLKTVLKQNSALNIAIKVFLLQAVVSIDEFDILFSKDSYKELENANLICVKDEKIYSLMSIFPIGGGFIFSDHTWTKLPHPNILEVDQDQVMYLGADSHWLARFTVRNSIENALDLCTGSGVHAILAANHSNNAYAVDINPRALKCVAYNAKMHDLTNVTPILSNVYECVPELKYDLITANPPFVPSPKDELYFRDGGRDGEAVQRKIVKELPKYLSENGIAQIVTEIGENDEKTLIDTLNGWLEYQTMDIVVLRLKKRHFSEYATYHADADGTYGEFFDSVDAWASNLVAQNYTYVSTVLIAIKHTKTKPLARIIDTPPPSGYIGNEIDEIFETHNLINSENFNEMLEVKKLIKSGTIGLLQAFEIGGNSKSKAQAQVFNKPLANFLWLEDVDFYILEQLNTPKNLHEIANNLGVNASVIKQRVSYLIGERFVKFS